ncbi:hypothetical protein BGX34_012213, partial [Mortierella sp. NVP85]
MTRPPSASPGKTDIEYSQTQRAIPLVDAVGIGMGMGMGMGMNTNLLDSPKTPKTLQQSQDELFSKLEALAAVKNKVIPLENGGQTRSNHAQVGGSNNSGRGGGSSQPMNNNNHLSMYNNNKNNNGLAHGGSLAGSFKSELREHPVGTQTLA